MPRRTKPSPDDDEDTNVIATRIMREATGQLPLGARKGDEGKNPAAVLLGRLGGLKGGKARAKKLSARRKKEIAKKAATARWKKRRA